ncbi:putative E3 ubiquitin-protein ligase RING1a isoform X1 [Typha latifolia]|uniref:putative E3 ubiquitin-protein ligase RING1a isoform X1 n=1 Tax=Typha latifolia TaxID=4733 RepID=UPI003C2CD261
MPAQKRPLPPPSDDHQDFASSPSPPQQKEVEEKEVEEEGEQEEAEQVGDEVGEQKAESKTENKDDSDAEEDSRSSESAADKDEFILVKLTDIRREVQCPICLGIIRKTRTVMECLHRFCRDCIDKSMRLGNNECPACRTHCASRRSLRDDPNYDALIAALYPDIDKYEEEELAFDEEEDIRNKKVIQASIAETFRRQTEALGKRKSTLKQPDDTFMRKYQVNVRAHGQNNYMRGRGRTGARDTSVAVSDDEEEEANGKDGSKESSSADEHSPDARQKRCRRWPVPRSSPARTSGIVYVGNEENDDVAVSKENLNTSPLRVGNREMLAWGKNGTRSQTRHGNASGSNNRMVKGSRIAKLVDYLRSLYETDSEFDVHLILIPLGGQIIPNLPKLYLCCRPTLSIRQLSQFISLQPMILHLPCRLLRVEEVEVYARRSKCQSLLIKETTSSDNADQLDTLEGLDLLEGETSLAELHASFSSVQGDLELVYVINMQS